MAIQSTPKSPFGGYVMIADSTGTPLVQRPTIKLASGITATDNPIDNSTDLSGGGGTLASLDAMRAGTTTMASAATLDLSSTTTEVIMVTGSTNISSLGTVAQGAVRKLIFVGGGGLIINGANLAMPAASNPQVNAGDIYEFESLGAGAWKCIAASSLSCGVSLNSNQVTLVSSGVAAMIVGGGALVQITAGTSLVVGGREQLHLDSAVASATTITLGTQGNVFPVTGTTPVTGITTSSWQAGSRVTLIPASASITFGHSASAGGIKTRTGAAVSPIANMAYDFVYDGTNWLLMA